MGNTGVLELSHLFPLFSPSIMIPIRISFLLLKKFLLLAKLDVLFKPVFFIYTLSNSIDNLNIFFYHYH